MRRYIEDDPGFEHIWRPDGPPQALLPPDLEPDYEAYFKQYGFNLSPEHFGRWVYEQTGRYLGVLGAGEPQPDADDPYRYARKFIPGGRLPWELD